MSLTDEELATCLDLLERSRELDPGDPRYLALENAAAHLRKQAKKKRKARNSLLARRTRARRQATN